MATAVALDTSQPSRCRKAPPFAVDLRSHLAKAKTWPLFIGSPADGRRPCIWLLIGSDAFQWAVRYRRQRMLLVCPLGEDPEAFDWSLLAHSSEPVPLIQCGAVEHSQLMRLARAALTAGVPRIYDMTADVSYTPQCKMKGAA